MISKVVRQIRYGYHHALDRRNWGYVEVIPNPRFIITNKASMVYKGQGVTDNSQHFKWRLIYIS